MANKKIAWLDSCGMDSHIHLTNDGIDTICGNHAEYIAERKLSKVCKSNHGASNFCRVCFSKGGKSLPWDSRCKEK